MFEIKSKVAEKLLGYYSLNPTARHYINELARILQVDPANLDKQLKKLETEGLFTSQIQGNLRYFALNKKYSLLDEFKKTYAFKYGVERKISQSLKDLKGLEEGYIFGSYAKNSFGAQSDIDILLIGNHSSLEAKRKLAKLENEFARELNVIDMTEQELTKRKKQKDDFVENLFKNKMIKII
jgi:predicted nucleotidyltransferase